MRILIKNGTLIDPAAGINGKYDLLINEGLVENVFNDDLLDSYSNTNKCIDKVVDADGLYVMPGFVDLHVHFRDPGLTYKETVKTGSEAASKGGYTSVFCMPNTKPVIDSLDNYRMLMDTIERDACINVFPVGAVTIDQKGEVISEMGLMAEAGMKAVSEDGKSVCNSLLYRSAMTKAKELGLTVFAHCEDIALVNGGVMNAGKRADELGLKGISNSVEDIIAARDILLAKETGVRLHLCHCSTEDSVDMLRWAKSKGVNVTAEVCPHHFTLADSDIPCDDSNYKMNPPLRTRKDINALITGLADGTIDAISTDHAPHSEKEKAQSMKSAPFGIVGLETAFALSYTELVDKGVITIDKLVECMSTKPSQIGGIDRGSLAVGKVADIAIVDLDNKFIINKNEFLSMGKNTPFDGRCVKGKVVKTLVKGNIVYEQAK